MKIRYMYWTKGKGISGLLKEPEDFAVREIIEPKFLKKYTTGKGVEKAKGRYALFLIKKRGLTTREAIKKLRALGWRDIGYAGLKDKFSVSWQYVSAIAEPKACKLDKIEVVPVGSSKKIFPGDLIANEFVITLHGCVNKQNLSAVAGELYKRGMPNYFGLQRFGRNENNHIIGKWIVKRRFSLALKFINKNGRKRYSSIKYVPKHLLKFFVNAYQSWIFNEALNEYIAGNKKPYFKIVPLIGYKTKLGNTIIGRIVRNICKKEGISTKDFRIDELRLSCSGGQRQAFIRLSGIEFNIGKNVKLAFTLPKGSYATVLLREICKN